jgi:hypothetical protein
MGKLAVALVVEDGKANLIVNSKNPQIGDLTTALAQLELLKIDFLTKIAKGSKIKKRRFGKDI